MLLHTLNALPDTGPSRDCIGLLAPGDALLLMGDGVYCALPGTASCLSLQNSGVEVFFLRDDAAARGVLETLWQGTTAVDMASFVALTERYPRQQAWY